MVLDNDVGAYIAAGFENVIPLGNHNVRAMAGYKSRNPYDPFTFIHGNISDLLTFCVFNFSTICPAE